MRLLLFLAASLLCSMAVVRDAHGQGRKPGSVLVYPVVRSVPPNPPPPVGGGGGGGGVGPVFFTVVCVTNTHLDPGGSTNAHFEYLNTIPNPANPFCPLACLTFNRIEHLTPGDTLSVLAFCHNAGFQNQEGYLVVSAQDPNQFDTAWSFNHLAGSQLTVNAVMGIYVVNVFSLQSPLPQGSVTDLDQDSQLDFDGQEYNGIPDQLYIDSFVAVGSSQLALINLTGGPNALNTVLFQVWNDNEFLVSTTLTFCCWFDQPLHRVSPAFSVDFLQANTPHNPAELDINCDGSGTIETGWARIESILVTTTGGMILDGDGALLGMVTAGPQSPIDGGRLLWESPSVQTNGQFVDFGQ
jgi:hypothetical protein